MPARSVLAAAIGAAILPFAASSQEIVIVTAQFREENLQDTPIAITAVTEDMMRERSMELISDVARIAPNVALAPAPGPFGSSMNAFIRGIGQDDFEFSREPGVGVYIDDIYFPTLTGSTFEILDLERVEILRGPQGTTQGRNSIGGAMRLITNKPDGDDGGYVEATFGEFDRVGGRAAGTFTIEPDTLYLRVAGVYMTQDGYQDRVDYACIDPAGAAAIGLVSTGIGNYGCHIGTLGGKSYAGGRAELRWTPSERLEINFIGDMVNDKSEQNPQTLLGMSAGVSALVPGYDQRFVPSNPYVTYETFINPDPIGTTTFTGPWYSPPVNYLTTEGIAAIVDLAIGDNMSFKSITSYREVWNEFATSTDGSPFAGETGWNHPEGESFQQEFRLNATVADGKFDLTGGIFLFEQDNLNTARIDIAYTPAFLNPFDFITDQTYESESLGVYGHLAYHVNDRANVIVGLRYSDEEKYQELYRKDPATGGQSGSTAPAFNGLVDPVTGFAGANTFSDDRVDYRLSFDYRFNPSVMGYVTASTGFKSGGVSPRFFFPSHIIPYGVEEAFSTEVGFKTDLADNRLRMNGAYFQAQYDDQQIGSPICPDLVPPAPCLADRNLVDSEISGFELEISYFVSNTFIIDASLSTIEQEFTRIDPNVSPTFRPDADTPEQTPGTKLSVGLQNSFELGGGSTLTPRLDVVDVDEVMGFNTTAVVGADQTMPLIIPAYTLINARLTWESSDEDWEMSLALTNATDEEYFHNLFDISTFGGWASGHIAPPRQWAMTMRRNF
jgi:iron complex outermembrane receptor protein